MFLKCSCPLAVALYFAALPCHAQYHVIPGDTDEDGCSGKQPARICTGASGTEHCYAPPSEMRYTFGLEPKAIPAGNLDGKPLILFSARYSGCGSDILTDYSLLVLENGEFVKISPKIQLTGQSEYQLWQVPGISPQPILATADFIWDFKTESHFSRHRYTIRAYAYDPSSGQYLEKVRYQTGNKFPGLDDTNEIHVLDSEKTHTLEHFLRKNQNFQ